MTITNSSALRAVFDKGVASDNPSIRATSAVSLACVDTSMDVPVVSLEEGLVASLSAIIAAHDALAAVPGVPQAAFASLQAAFASLADLGLHVGERSGPAKA